MVIGAAILDVLVCPAGKEVFEIGSSPAEDIRISFGGDAMNEACVLAALGKKVYLETITGNDAEGKMIISRCRALGIELGDSILREEMKTGINVVLVQKNGERNFLTNRNGSLRKLRLEYIARPYPKDAQILCFASIFVFPEIENTELVEIFRQAKEQNIIVCADMTKRKKGETVEDIAEALSYVDYLIPNEEEVVLLTGKKSVEEAAEILHQAGVKHVIIKCGSRGCYISSENIKMQIPAIEGIKPIDTTGAGDSFAAGFIYGLSEGWSLEQCARFGNECGARAVQHVGATTWCERKNL